MSVVAGALPYVVNKDLYIHVSFYKMLFMIILGFSVAMYNLIVMFNKANTKRYIVKDEMLKKEIEMNRNKRSEEL